jgi:hypothetical protein
LDTNVSLAWSGNVKSPILMYCFYGTFQFVQPTTPEERYIMRVANDAYEASFLFRELGELAIRMLRRTQWFQQERPSIDMVPSPLLEPQNQPRDCHREPTDRKCLIYGLHWRVEEDVGGNPDANAIRSGLRLAGVPVGSILYIGWFLSRHDLSQPQNVKYMEAFRNLCLNSSSNAMPVLDTWNCVLQSDVISRSALSSRQEWSKLHPDLRAYIDFFIFTKGVDCFISHARSTFTSLVQFWRLQRQQCLIEFRILPNYHVILTEEKKLHMMYLLGEDRDLLPVF